MHAVVKWLYLLALVVWVGEVVFFSFVAAPALFRTFPVVDAGRAVGAIFPTYYRLGYACLTLVLLGCVLFLATGASRAWWAAGTALAAVALAATLYAGVVVQPRATALRPQLHAPEAPADVKVEFDRLHRLAVQLNGAALLCGLAISAITAAALKP
jgi:uncharacterized membrane protein